MYPNNTSHGKTPDAWMTHSLGRMHGCGLEAGQVLAAEEQHLALQQLALQSKAIHRDQKQSPRKWRQWSGGLLVRAGNRLQGAVSAGPPLTSESR